LEAAGIDYSTIRVELQNHVVCLICNAKKTLLSRHLETAHRMATQEYLEEYPGADLICETILAGRNQVQRRDQMRKEDRLMRDWEPLHTPEYVMDQIWELRRRGYELNYKSVEKVYPVLISRAENCFGNWSAALEAVGLDPAKERKIGAPYLTKREVIAAIRARKKEGLPLNSDAVWSGKHSKPGLLAGGRRLWGTWRNAVEAAGVDYPSTLRYPTKEAVMKAIKGRLKLGASRLRVQKVCKGADGDHTLYRMAQKFFGSWRSAMKAAGCFEAACGSWAKYPASESVLAEIKRRNKRRLSLRSTEVLAGKHRDIPLYQFAGRFFGNWRTAIKKAGLAYDRI
jgi:hypothetical protein